MENATKIEDLCRRYGVVRLRLFGSALSDSWDAERSDFDFLADFGDPPVGINAFHQMFGFIEEMETLLGRKVDVVDWKAARNPYFRKIAEAQAEELFAA